MDVSGRQRSGFEAKVWWIVHRPRPAAKIKLFCFPYAGGNATVFSSWADGLPDYVEILCLQLPGRANRLWEPPFTAVPDLVTTLAKSIRDMVDKPFILLGHSLGALLCFEVARWLQLNSERLPHHLFVSGCGAPQIPRDVRRSFDGTDDDFISRVRELEGTPREVLENPELRRLILPTLRADFQLAETYTYIDGDALPCSITAFGGANDNECVEDKIDHWRFQTSRIFRKHIMAGNHFFIRSSEAEFLAILREELRLIASHGI